MTEKDLDVAIEKCERIMEFDTRTMKNPESENGYIFEKVYDLLQFLRQFQFATNTNVDGTDTISREAVIETVRKAKSIGQAHRMLIQLPSAQTERKKGKWIERNPRNSPDCRLIECSECGNAYIVGYNINYDDWIDGRNFCMKCGADLRGGSNDKST